MFTGHEQKGFTLVSNLLIVIAIIGITCCRNDS